METVKNTGVGIADRELRRAVLLERSRRLGTLRRPMSTGAARSALDASATAVRRRAERAA